MTLCDTCRWREMTFSPCDTCSERTVPAYSNYEQEDAMQQAGSGFTETGKAQPPPDTLLTAKDIEKCLCPLVVDAPCLSLAEAQAKLTLQEKLAYQRLERLTDARIENQKLRKERDELRAELDRRLVGVH